MKKLVLIAVSLLCSVSSVAAAAFDIEFPNEFYVKERPYSLMSTFDIETKQYKLGYVQKRFLSLRLEYDFYDIYDTLQAKAQKRLWSFGAVFDVVDANEIPIGTIEQEFSFFFPRFRMLSATGEKLAEAVLNFWGTRYTVTSPLYKNQVATLTRPFFRFKDDWTITILEPSAFAQNKIDPRLFMVLMAFQTDKEYWQKVRDSAKPRGAEDGTVHLKKKLSQHRKKLAGVKPKAKHFTRVEKHTEALVRKAKDATFFSTCEKLTDLLDSKELCLEEKKALYMMLKDRVPS